MSRFGYGGRLRHAGSVRYGGLLDTSGRGPDRAFLHAVADQQSCLAVLYHYRAIRRSFFPST